MKKILTVALSTAMAFSMFASVAFGDSAVSVQEKYNSLEAKGIFNGYPDKQAHLERDMTRAEFAKVLTKLLGLKEVTGTLSYKDKGYDAKNWAVPYIEAVTAAGIMEGQDKVKQIFNYNGKVTVEEMATALVRALKLEVPANADNSASSWAKGYIQVAIDKGLIAKEANFQANATREQLVVAAYQADQLINLSVKSYKVADNGKDIEFTLSSGEVVKVTLEKALEPNKETEVKFKNAAGQEITAKVTWKVDAATKVASASSTNLKEVEVVFDGKVDKVTATDKNNYTIDNNSKGIQSIKLLPDNKTVRILLNDSSKFAQGTTYKVVVKNVKASNGNVLPQGEVSFASSDNTLPTVTEVKGLGTKVVKVTFSEPIVAPSSSNFQIDDKAFVGSVTLGPDKREVILRDYSGGFAVGAHKLTASLIEDYAGLKSTATTNEFTSAVETEGPKVTDISATLEKVNVTFDKEVDPTSVTNDSFYWKSGDTKKTGKVTQISSNEYEIDFSANRLPGYETTLFVEVKDYSGNANAVKEHKVTATVDLVQPRVVDTTFGVDRNNTLTVRFDKAVDAADKKYFTVKQDGDVVPISNVVAADTSNKIFYVSFYSKLEGTYDLKIADVKDKTALQNTMVAYSGTFVASDTSNPTISSTDYNESTRKVTLNFGKVMDASTVQLKSNYFVTFQKNTATNTQNLALPNEVSINVVNGGKSVVLQFPEYIDGTRVTFGPSGSVKGIWTTGLKSQTGQAVSLDSATLKSAAENQLKWIGAVQKDAKTFELTFNQVIASASTSDFLVNGTYPASVTVSDGKVTLKTNDSYNGANITLFANNSIETYSNNKLNLSSDAVMPANNTVAPRVTSVDQARNADNQFTVTFSTYVAARDVDQVKNDFIIKNLGDTNYPIVSPAGGYDVEFANATNKLGSNQVRITIKDTKALDKPVSVKVRKDAQYLVAGNDQTKAAIESDEYTVAPSSQSVEAVKVVSTKFEAGTPAVAAFANQYGLKLTAKTAGAAGNGLADVKLVTGVDATTQTEKVKISNTEISVQSGATLQDILDAAEKATLNFTVAKGDGELANGVLKFQGGADAVNGKVTAKLSKAVTIGNGGKVTISNSNKSTTYDATINANNELVVNVGTDKVAGDQLTATVVDGGKNVELKVIIAN